MIVWSLEEDLELQFESPAGCAAASDSRLTPSNKATNLPSYRQPRLLCTYATGQQRIIRNLGKIS